MAKAKTAWWVLKQADEVLVPVYRGPDRKTAREKAARELNANPKESLIVAKVGSLTVLRESDLQRHLPKTAF